MTQPTRQQLRDISRQWAKQRRRGYPEKAQLFQPVHAKPSKVYPRSSERERLRYNANRVAQEIMAQIDGGTLPRLAPNWKPEEMRPHP
jgi:hypothetical protein